MDTTNTNPTSQNQNPIPNGVVGPVQQPITTQTQKSTPAPVGGGGKEAPKMPGLTSSEWVAPSTPEVNLPQEVREVGVESQPLVHPVPQTAQDAGVKLAKEATPVDVTKEPMVDINTPRAVLQSLKKAHSSIKDSFRWLVELVTLAQDKKDRQEKGGSL